MSDTKDDKTLSVNPKKTLTLKRPGMEQGTVRQNFSHGRTKAVVVETKKRKFSLPGEKQEAPQPAVTLKPRAPQPEAPQPPAPPRPAAPAAPSSRSGMVLNELSTEEMDARRRALQDSKVREVEERKRAAEDAARRAEEEERRRHEREESARRQAEEEARLQAEAEARRRSEEEARRRAPAAETRAVEDEEEAKPRGAAAVKRGPVKPEVATPKPVKAKGEEDRRRGKLTLNAALAGDEARGRSLSSMRRRQEKFKRAMHGETREKIMREVVLPETITIQELANRMAERAVDIVKYFMKQGQMMKPGDVLDADTAELVASEFGHTVRRVAESDVEEGLFNIEDNAEDLKSRSPVVTIMGHVDHGKTSLLDYIRRTKVQAGEAGGITQHIGAYHVPHDKGAVTFIDTPGHAAFTRMRARGAEITDIAILIVAADDGVMPQTKESIQHAKAAGVPIVVAVTKMDVASADIEKVRAGLAAEDLIPEDWGGDIQVVPVSSKTGDGIDDLLDAVLLQAEVSEFKAPLDVPARGVVIESSLEKGRGPVATILVKAGKLKRGDTILAGPHHGRVRAMFNELGEQVKEAGPSIPVEVLGLSGTPEAGDAAFVVANEKKAKEIAAQREEQQRESKLAQQQAARLEEVFSAMGEDGPAETKDLNLLVKGDVQGSVEALVESLRKIPAQEVKIRIVSSGVGGISESDVELAMASQAIIIGFNVRADNKARKAIAESGVDVRYYSVIYEAIEDVTDAVSGLLGTELREEIIGLAEVRDVFRSSKLGAIAGCVVADGAVVRGQPIRVLRDNVVIYEGELESLRRHRDDVNRVPAGTECGIGVKNYNDIKAGDQIEVYERTEVQRKVDVAETA